MYVNARRPIIVEYRIKRNFNTTHYENTPIQIYYRKIQLQKLKIFR